MHKGQVDNVVIDFLRNDTDGTSMLVKVHSVHQNDFGSQGEKNQADYLLLYEQNWLKEGVEAMVLKKTAASSK